MPVDRTDSPRTTSFLDSIERDASRPLDKMSKSRGNAVSVDMVVHGVFSIEDGYEFRDVHGLPIKNWKQLNIWRNKNGDGQFYCGASLNAINRQMFGSRFQWLPVFIAITGEKHPARLLIDGKERMQHPRLHRFWDAAAKADPDEFYETGQVDYYLQSNDYTRAGVYCKHG